MDGPTLVAGISVVVAGVTSLGAPLIAGRNQRRSDAARFAYETDRAELADLRVLLDEVAELTHNMTQTLIQLEHSFSRRLKDKNEVASRFHEQRTRLGYLTARLLVRVGDIRVSGAVGDLTEVLDNGNESLRETWSSGEPPEELQEGEKERAHTYWLAYQEVVEAAQALVGMSVGTDERERAHARRPVPESRQIPENHS